MKVIRLVVLIIFLTAAAESGLLYIFADDPIRYKSGTDSDLFPANERIR